MCPNFILSITIHINKEIITERWKGDQMEMELEEMLWNVPAKASGGTWLPLMYHAMDTAVVAEFLLEHTMSKDFFNEIKIEKDVCVRLVKLAALLHDIGKCTPIFVSKITASNVSLQQYLNDIGLVSAQYNHRYDCDPEFYHAKMGANILRYFYSKDYISPIASIIGAHHGIPERANAQYNGQADYLAYQAEYGYNDIWERLQRNIIAWALQNVYPINIYQDPSIVQQDMDQLRGPAQMILNGLIILADWIASNSMYFPLMKIGKTIPTSYDNKRREEALTKLKDLPDSYVPRHKWDDNSCFETRFKFPANDMQKAVINLMKDSDKGKGLLIIESPMGAGKTEAALAAIDILIQRYQLSGFGYFLPTQATSDMMFSRIVESLDNESKASIELAYSGSELNDLYMQLKMNSNDDMLVVNDLFSSNVKTNLLPNVVIGTIDQLLAMTLKHAHIQLKHLGVCGKVVVIDEVHSSDTYTNVHLDRALSWLGALDIPVILLSATLTNERRNALVQAYAGPKIEIPQNNDFNFETRLSWTNKKECVVTIMPCKEHKIIHIEKCDKSSFLDNVDIITEGGCIGIMTNSVRDAQALYDELAANPKLEHHTIFLDHACYFGEDRKSMEEDIIKHTGKNAGKKHQNVIVIGTHVLEQSLDINFDLIYMELCPLDKMFQFIGRLHRHTLKHGYPKKFKVPKCIIFNHDFQSDNATNHIYDAWILKMTNDVIDRVLTKYEGKIDIPADIHPLLEAAFDTTNPKYYDDYMQYENKRKSLINEANQNVLEMPRNNQYTDALCGLLDERCARAQGVRYILPSIDVIVVQNNGSTIRIMSGAQKGVDIDANEMANNSTAALLLTQKIKLCGIYIKELHDVLDNYKRNKFAELMSHNMLKKELIIALDSTNSAQIGNFTIYYSKTRGLAYTYERNKSNEQK